MHITHDLQNLAISAEVYIIDIGYQSVVASCDGEIVAFLTFPSAGMIVIINTMSTSSP